MFRVHRHASGRCEVRLDVQERSVEDLLPTERRAFMHLGPSLAAVNAWLITLGADTGYAPGTGYEYAKVLMYALEWLAQEPVSLITHEPLGHSLLTLSRADLRALFAWLDIPARQKTARARLAKTGELPPNYRAMSLALFSLAKNTSWQKYFSKSPIVFNNYPVRDFFSSLSVSTLHSRRLQYAKSTA